MAGTALERIGSSTTRSTTTQTLAVKAKSGVLHRILIEAALTGTVTINDGVGLKTILPIAFPAGVYSLFMACAGKIEVVTSANDRIVLFWE